MSEVSMARERKAVSLKSLSNALTSAQKHAVNALLDRLGWTMEKAVRYISSLDEKENDRIRAENFRQRAMWERQMAKK